MGGDKSRVVENGVVVFGGVGVSPAFYQNRKHGRDAHATCDVAVFLLCLSLRYGCIHEIEFL